MNHENVSKTLNLDAQTRLPLLPLTIQVLDKSFKLPNINSLIFNLRITHNYYFTIELLSCPNELLNVMGPYIIQM